MTELIHGDVLEWAQSYSGQPFSAMLCDPPYCLTSITKRFGAENAAPAKSGKSGVYSRASAGFMGQKWDNDIAFEPETWASLSKHLHPGAFVMAFAGTRGWHRQAVAMEDAGLIQHPSIAWIFGSGFPKATRIKGDPAFSEHRYGLQALKPAFEPILVAQKPYRGKPVDCITKTGAGSLNIGAGRIGTNGGTKATNHVKKSDGRLERWDEQYRGARNKIEAIEAGRWPSNLLLSEEVAGALDAQSGHLVSGKPAGVRNAKSMFIDGKQTDLTGFGDAGGASRFFFQSDWQAEEVDPFFPFVYQAKAGRAERSAGLDSFPLQERTTQGRDVVREIDRKDGRGVVAVNAQIQPSANNHPCCKPLRLCRYLASLLLPPVEYAPRRLLVPFAGVGSEMCGAHLAGWEEIVGIEQSEEYCEIGRARLRFWSCNAGLFESLTAEDEDAEPEQFGMEF